MLSVLVCFKWLMSLGSLGMGAQVAASDSHVYISGSKCIHAERSGPVMAMVEYSVGVLLPRVVVVHGTSGNVGGAHAMLISGHQHL
jgi:hypothetical protein